MVFGIFVTGTDADTPPDPAKWLQTTTCVLLPRGMNASSGDGVAGVGTSTLPFRAVVCIHMDPEVPMVAIVVRAPGVRGSREAFAGNGGAVGGRVVGGGATTEPVSLMGHQAGG